MTHPVVRSLQSADTREHVRLPAGGTVWVTSDGSLLTEAVCAALGKRDFRCEVIRLEEGSQAGARRAAVRIDHPGTSRHGATRRSSRTRFGSSEPRGRLSNNPRAQGGAALLTVSRLEGTFGLTGLGAESNPAAGALAGMAKTAGQEWREVHCKAVDLAPGFDSASRSRRLDRERIVPSRSGRSRPEPRGPSRRGARAGGKPRLEPAPAGPRRAGRSGRHQRRGTRGHRRGRGRPGRVVRASAGVARSNSRRRPPSPTGWPKSTTSPAQTCLAGTVEWQTANPGSRRRCATAHGSARDPPSTRPHRKCGLAGHLSLGRRAGRRRRAVPSWKRFGANSARSAD